MHTGRERQTIVSMNKERESGWHTVRQVWQKILWSYVTITWNGKSKKLTLYFWTSTPALPSKWESSDSVCFRHLRFHRCVRSGTIFAEVTQKTCILFEKHVLFGMLIGYRAQIRIFMVFFKLQSFPAWLILTYSLNCVDEVYLFICLSYLIINSSYLSASLEDNEQHCACVAWTFNLKHVVRHYYTFTNLRHP